MFMFLLDLPKDVLLSSPEEQTPPLLLCAQRNPMRHMISKQTDEAETFIPKMANGLFLLCGTFLCPHHVLPNILD